LTPVGVPAAPPGVPGSLTGAIGYRVTTEGAELALAPYVRNSFGALNGGIVAGLAETAAVGERAGVARQLTAHHPRPAAVGPGGAPPPSPASSPCTTCGRRRWARSSPGSARSATSGSSTATRSRSSTA